MKQLEESAKTKTKKEQSEMILNSLSKILEVSLKIKNYFESFTSVLNKFLIIF